MKTLLTGMPYKPSHEPQDVQETWRKYGWKPTGEVDSADDETQEEIEQSLEYFETLKKHIRYIEGDR